MKRFRRRSPQTPEEEQARSVARGARGPAGTPGGDREEPAQDPQRFLAVQRTLGNREAARLLEPGPAAVGEGPSTGSPDPPGAVRVHAGPEAAALAARLGARAFTSGRDIWLGTGESPTDARLMAHELAHVAQQAEGRVAGGPGQVRPAGDVLEREAEGVAAQGAGALASVMTVSSGAAPAAAGAVQRQERPEVGTVTLEEERVTGSPTGVSQRPVTEGPLETQPTGIEGSPVEPILQSFLDTIRDDVNDWRSYRNTFQAPIPGEQSYGAVRALEAELRRYNESARSRWLPMTDEEGNDIPCAPFDRYDQRVHSYLARTLGPEQLFLLREMLSFGRTSEGLAPSSVSVAEFFHIETIALQHQYRARVEISVGVGGGAFLQGMAAIRMVEIRYQNNLGMSYTKPLVMAGGGIGGGGGYQVGQQGRRPSEGGTSLGGDLVVAEGTSNETVVFWEPDDFEGLFSTSKAGATVTGGVGPVTPGGVECKLFDIMTFYETDRGVSISFNMMGADVCGIAGPSISPGEPEIGAEARAGVEVQFGFAFSGGEALVSSPDIPPPERRETGEWRTLLESQLFFETGQAEVGDDLQETIAHVVEATQEFNVAHPDYGLRFRISGNASPRWRHSRGQVPHDLNVALSDRRARNTLEQIRNLFRAAGDATCSFEFESCAGQEVSVDDPTWDAMVEAQGPIEALGEGRHPDDDWWYDRRVDIIVYRTEFGIVTEQPPPIPGSP